MTYRVDYIRARRLLLDAIERRKPARLWIDRLSGRIVGRQTDIAAASGIRDQDIQNLRKAFPKIRVYEEIMVDALDVAAAYGARAAIAEFQAQEAAAEEGK